jgi:hypothetical protein
MAETDPEGEAPTRPAEEDDEDLED